MRMRIRVSVIFFNFDPGSGAEKIRIRRDKHFGSATLIAIHERHIGEKSSRAAPFLQGRIVDVRAQGPVI